MPMKKERAYRIALAFQRGVCSLVLTCLSRALRGLEHCDSRVRKEMEQWPEGFCVALELPGGPSLRLRHTRKGGLAPAGKMVQPDVLIRFKSVRDAFYLCTGQLGVAGAYAQHRFVLRGNVSSTMGFVRCIDLAEGYLFPRFWARRILKEVPSHEVPAIRVYLAVLLGR